MNKTSENIWEEFDSKINVEDYQKEIQEAAENGPERKEVPLGQYEVKIHKLKLTLSKTQKPMMTCWFKVLTGKFRNSIIFYNQVVDEPYKIHIANDFLRSLDSGVDVTFDGYANYANLIMDVAEATENLEYALDYDENNKGYKTYEITEVFDAA